MKLQSRLAAFIAAGCVAMTSAAIAQDQSPRVAVFDDWSVFQTTGGTPECWIVSAPTEQVARRGGNTVEVRRGEIRMMVSFRPSQNVAGEVSYTGGYPYRADGAVQMQIENRTFELFTDGEWAWPATPAIDQDIIAAMRAGREAIVTGVSSRGTTTIDTISAIGFTAAFNDAQGRCN
ncbi:MAG: invasion associated locus B family protein [Rubricella sp.]